MVMRPMIELFSIADGCVHMGITEGSSGGVTTLQYPPSSVGFYHGADGGGTVKVDRRPKDLHDAR
jgi:hypothetical protein